jgi:MFS family permease
MSKNMRFFGTMMPFIMWFIPLLFFTHQFMLRLWPGLTMEHILTHFAIDATLFGTLASSYYYGYAGMQIPVALLLDRYGARVIVCLSALLCGVATLTFTYTDSFYVALISRFFVGAGSAAGFLGVSKVISEWFNPKAFAKMTGFSFTVGFLGALYGGKPLSLFVEQYNEETIALILGLISIGLACITYLFLRSPKTTRITTPHDETLSLDGLKSILSSKIIWIIGIANLLMVGVLEGFADVWGVQFLVTAYSLIKSDAAGLVSCIFLGMLIGGPLLAYLGEKIGKYTVAALSGLGMAFIFILLLSNVISLSWLPYIFFASGIMCCYQVIIFALGSELVSHKNMGICIAFLNSINMFGGSFFHTMIGVSMDRFGGAALNASGARLYDLHAYQYALSIIPICALIGGLSFIFLAFRKMPQRSLS